MSAPERTVAQRIRDAAVNRRGLRLTAEEVRELYGVEAIMDWAVKADRSALLTHPGEEGL